MSIGNLQPLQRYARPQFTSSSSDDVNAPFSYRDWLSSHQGLIPGQEFNQYNEYLVTWYKTKSLEATDFKLKLKLNYLTLLKRLQLFFTQEEAENWYNQVNLDNEKELLLAIPYFAKKLKDISLYYLQLRNNVKESKLKYNQTGTNSGLVQQLQKFLLTNYTKKTNTSISLPPSVWRNVPELSSIKNTIGLQISELYDAQDYFDQAPTIPLSSYYNTNNEELETFLKSKGLLLSDTEWIYKLGSYALSSSIVSLNDTVSAEVEKLNYQLSEKYLGQDKYTSFTLPFSSRIDQYEIDINQGNNFFYWPQGVYESVANSLPRYKETDINNFQLNSVATAGSSIELADTIFVKTARGLEGAWFRKQLYEYRTENIKSFFEGGDKTSLRFPFPGYGLSANDSDWTGYGLTYEPRFFFLSEQLKQSVENEYWSGDTSLTAINPLKINNTTLIKDGAYANRDYNKADQITVWSDPPTYTTTSISQGITEAWLYRFNKTDISVAPESDSIIVWPYEKINPGLDFPNYYSDNLTDVCLSESISSINFAYAVAGDALSSSDVIYKITNYKHTPDLAIECCWLSGTPTYYPESNLFFPYQENFQLLAKTGEYSNFIWNGVDNTDAEIVFKTIKHQPDCKFVTTLNTTYKESNLCDCKQVMFVPFGHPGSNYYDYNNFADFIIEGEFVPGITDLTQYTSTSAFAWYKTNSNIGFGDGRWFSGNNNTDNKFYLQKGKTYTYYRASIQTQDSDIVFLPDYVVRYKFPPQPVNNTQWMRGIKNSDGSWMSSDVPSNLTVSPGSLLIYKRASTLKYSLTGLTVDFVDISENRGSIWTNYDYVTLNNNKLVNIGLTYPSQTLVDNTTELQIPLPNDKIVQIIQWEVTNPESQKTYFKNTPVVTFVPTLTGIYSFAVTAMSAETFPPETTTSITTDGTTFYYTNTGIYIFTNIPSLTTTSELGLVPTLTSYNTPVPGYVINSPLKGWDYGINAYNPFAKAVNAGAKPFWAKTYTEKNQNTNFKGINAIGTPQRFLDQHNIITQPEFSDIVLEAGNALEYKRNYPVGLNWNQPTDLIITIDTNNWCALEFTTTNDSNISYFLENYQNKLIVTPTTSTSQIKIQNFVDNEPVEVFYNAVNSFVWNVSVEPTIPETVINSLTTEIGIKADQPWANLSNRFYPTVAAFPALNNLYSDTDIGGYLLPQNLGVSVFLNQNYTTTLDLTSSTLSTYFEDNEKYYKGRGLSLLDQNTPYNNLINNSSWLKEPTVTGPIAGTIKKSVFKKYQKFIPYQSVYETNPRSRIGMLTPVSRQTPWSKEEEPEWEDLQNKPQSPTGELNVKAWADSQILKQNNLQVDYWCTDIFGNQYALYKALSATTPHTRKFTNGEIWVRKNSQFAAPAVTSLKDVFDTFKGTNLFNELNNYGIKKIDIFFDTLLIQTSGAIIFEKLNYDFSNDNIFSLTDEGRYISLALPISSNLVREFNNTDFSSYNFALPGETWFFPEEKLVAQSICGLEQTKLTPELYLLDLNSLILRKVFPSTTDSTTINELTSLNLQSIDPPTLTYNSTTKEYLFSVLGKNSKNKNVLIEFKIKNLSQVYLEEVVIYEPPQEIPLLDPPYITENLRTNVYITNIEFLNALAYQINLQNGPGIFEPIDLPQWVSLSQSGLFTGTPPLQNKEYTAEFKVTNSVGSSYYSLTINVNYTEILTIYYLVTQGYPFDGYLVQEEHDVGDLNTGFIARIIE